MPELTNAQKKHLQNLSCDVQIDPLTKQLYATDASIYQVEPLAVAFPKTLEQAAELIAFAAQENISVIPRGAGTGLAGGAIGNGIVIDFARHNRQISQLDKDNLKVHVGAGVVLDQLNAYLAPHGFRFGPDVATSSRATLGGMIGNNSSGSHVPVYGTTADHILQLDMALGDGRIVHLGDQEDSLSQTLSQQLINHIQDYKSQILEEFSGDIYKRWPGYGVLHYLKNQGSIAQVISGSEGTLAGIMSATVKISPLPKQKQLVVIKFATIEEAMQATVDLLDLSPAAIEHIDSPLFNQTRDHLAFTPVRHYLKLDEEACESMLLVEFFDGEVADKVNTLQKRGLGLRTIVCETAQQTQWVWNLRKAGLNLLTSCAGPAKPIAGIEDAAVSPKQLPEYVAGLREILKPLGTPASFYGHAASGLLHVRPVLDLHLEGDIVKYRQIAEQVSQQVKRFKGSIAAEHGVGIARTEFLKEHLSGDILELFGKMKQLLDNKGIMNPGKILCNGTYKTDQNLRYGAGYQLKPNFSASLDFYKRDKTFVGNLEQCNGCGGCLKQSGTMCPTFQATGMEIMSTRGRSNTIRAVLDHRIQDSNFDSPELEAALKNCLSCKACKTECPSNVDIASLKSQLLHARFQKRGIPTHVKMISHVDFLGKFGCKTSFISNWFLNLGITRKLMEVLFGFASQRPFPKFASQRFDHWWNKNYKAQNGEKKVILWDDTFTRYYDPHIGQAAVKVLQAFGYEVSLVKNRKCCGRPAFSVGNLDLARNLAIHNLAILNDDDTPILFLEPSCFSMFKEDYRQLSIPNAEKIAARAILFEDFIAQILPEHPDVLNTTNSPIAIHAHCHAKALGYEEGIQKILQYLPKEQWQVLDTGCCGMAGAFGARKETYDLSLQVGKDIVQKVQPLQATTDIICAGTSCRHQLSHLTERHPIHPAELLAKLV